MMQFFHWYLPADGSLWRQVAAQAGELAAGGDQRPVASARDARASAGPSTSATASTTSTTSASSTRRAPSAPSTARAPSTSRRSQAVQGAGLQVYADTVFNHRMGADATELVRATPFPSDDRLRPKGAPRDIRAYTSFRFPGRRGKHSRFEWNASHFDAVDFDDLRPDERNTVYLFDGKSFDDQVALENGNYAYLMGADVDFQNPAVQEELIAWGKWFLDTTGVDGFRLDAVKHISAWFFPRWIEELERHAGRDLFFVGEYWSPDVFGSRTLCRRHGRTHERLRRRAALPLRGGGPAREPLRHATALRQHSRPHPQPRRRHLRRQPRQPADAGPGVDRRPLVQAPRLRDHPPAAGGLPLHLLPRLLRSDLRGPGEATRSRCPLTASSSTASSTPGVTTPGARRSTTSTTGTGSDGCAWATPSTPRPWPS